MKKRNSGKGAVKAATVEHSQDAAQAVAGIIKPVTIIVGGTRLEGGKIKNLATVNAAEFAPVTGEQVKQYAGSWKQVNVGLTMNLLAGINPAPEVLNRDNAEVWTRGIKGDKRAFFYMVDNGNAELFRQSWEMDLQGRKRFDQPTLQALAKALRRFKAAQLGGENRRLSPMEKFARDCMAILDNRGMSADERIRAVRKALEEKSGLDDQRAEKQAKAA